MSVDLFGFDQTEFIQMVQITGLQKKTNIKRDL